MTANILFSKATIDFVFPVRCEKEAEKCKCNQDDGEGSESSFGTIAKYIKKFAHVSASEGYDTSRTEILTGRGWGWKTLTKNLEENVCIADLQTAVAGQDTSSYHAKALTAMRTTSGTNEACPVCTPVRFSNEVPEPLVMTTATLVSKNINKDQSVQDRLRYLAERRLTTNGTKDNVDWWTRHNRALGEKWACLMTGRGLLIVLTTDPDEKITSLAKHVRQAVSFVWAETTLINEINQDLDLVVGEIQGDLSGRDSQKRQKALKEILGDKKDKDGKIISPGIVNLRQRYLYSLFDPSLYAFPAGTVLDTAAAAREFFRTGQARHQVLHKFETLDRYLDDCLQLAALG